MLQLHFNQSQKYLWNLNQTLSHTKKFQRPEIDSSPSSLPSSIDGLTPKTPRRIIHPIKHAHSPHHLSSHAHNYFSQGSSYSTKSLIFDPRRSLLMDPIRMTLPPLSRPGNSSIIDGLGNLFQIIITNPFIIKLRKKIHVILLHPKRAT